MEFFVPDPDAETLINTKEFGDALQRANGMSEYIFMQCRQCTEDKFRPANKPLPVQTPPSLEPAVKSPVSDGHPLMKPAMPGVVSSTPEGDESEGEDNEQILMSFPVGAGKRAFQISPKPVPTAAAPASTAARLEPVQLLGFACEPKEGDHVPLGIHFVVEPVLACQPPPSDGVGVLSAIGSFLSQPVTRGDVLAFGAGLLLGHVIDKMRS